jgi:hypothetical protein
MSNDDTLSCISTKPTTTTIVSHLGLQYDNGDIKQCYNQNCGWLSPTQRSWLSRRGILDGHKSSDHRFPKDDTRSKQHLRQIEIKSVGTIWYFRATGRSPVLKFSGRSSTGMEFIQNPPTRRLSSRVSFRLKACRSSRNAHLFAIIWKCISATIYRSS